MNNIRTKNKKNKKSKLNPMQAKLVEDNIFLAYSRASKMVKAYSNNQLLLDKDDFESYAFEGLCEAALRYDESKGVKFSTFAVSYMDNIIKTNVHIENSTIKIPTYSPNREKMKKLRKEALTNSLMVSREYCCQDSDGSSNVVSIFCSQGMHEKGFKHVEGEMFLDSIEENLDTNEKYIFRELLEGEKTIFQIACELNVHPNTVSRGKKRIARKIDKIHI